MSNIAQINDTQVSIINFKSIPVVTTEMLADFYGTDINNIRQNFSRNSDRFVQGKHYIKLEGTELKDFKNSVTDSHAVKKGARTVNLWTERGAARHAKMLDTDQAWDIFEQLEDCYFHRQEILAKTHKSERTALHDAHTMLVAKTKHLSSSDAWKLIHQRFNVDDIALIPYDAIPVAVEYVHHLIALYSNAEKSVREESKPWQNMDVQFLMWYVPILSKLIKNNIHPALSLLGCEYAGLLLGYSQEISSSANVLNKLAIKDGMTHYTHLGGQPVHALDRH
ncbi:ORF6N domain-containing protein [Acinetobacter sp. CFCC 10889]|uniref:ORF6N domain-containing protein n=1 Tax=Acinetobacter sp. CFCC 10889 TaxID=1775557 RepID=UPI000DD0D8F4|nr:ORF6N domain-containing protein [Acinetobacter sp. CFCC 10889]